MSENKKISTTTKGRLFVELAKPDENGVSRWVDKAKEFIGKKYSVLMFNNGLDFGRKGSWLDKNYKIDIERGKGGKIIKIRLNGFNTEKTFNQNIRKNIKDFYKNKNCVMLGVNGDSANVKIEIDHKDGRKSDLRVSDIKTQKLEDFQPLCKAANDVKREICKKCVATGKRWNAKNLKGNPYSFYDGDENYTAELGCVGCYQYDPVEYRKTSVKRICDEATKNTCKFIFDKLYSDDE